MAISLLQHPGRTSAGELGVSDLDFCTVPSLRSPMSSPPPASAPVNVHDPFHDPFVPRNQYGQIHMAACDMCLRDEVFQRVDSVNLSVLESNSEGGIFQVINFEAIPRQGAVLLACKHLEKQLVAFEENPPGKSEATTTTSTSSRSSSSRWGCRKLARFFFGVRGFRLKKHGGKRNEVLSEDVHVEF